jgi:hypothetical protein
MIPLIVRTNCKLSHAIAHQSWETTEYIYASEHFTAVLKRETLSKNESRIGPHLIEVLPLKYLTRIDPALCRNASAASAHL